MSPAYTYLMVDLGCLIAPLLISFYPKFAFYKKWKFFVLPCLITAFLFLCWDALYTYFGVWGFSREYTLGLYYVGLPIEEYLFFICIPFACVFTYHAFDLLFQFSGFERFAQYLFRILAIGLLIAGLINYGKLYTAATFICTGILLLFLTQRPSRMMTVFFFAFLFILIPFLISNGILTGSFLNRVVVYYNNEENLGIRILTIPFEDVFYGMLLLLMNVWGYELAQRWNAQPAFRLRSRKAF